jgi:prepilin-type N-terminal cleavage/methylation domain-containing protein
MKTSSGFKTIRMKKNRTAKRETGFTLEQFQGENRIGENPTSGFVYGVKAMRHSRRAFTLIELLVVIAIIGVLISMLLPVLGQVREQSRRMVCGSNQREILLTLQYYISDHQGALPWVRYVEADGRTWHPIFAMARSKYFDIVPGILQCPGYINWSLYFNGWLPQSPMVAPINSLNGGDANSVCNSYNWRRFTDEKDTNQAKKMKIDQIPSPSREWYVCDLATGPLSFWPSIVTPSHGGGKGGQSGYVDGHVEFLDARKWVAANSYMTTPPVPGDLLNP